MPEDCATGCRNTYTAAEAAAWVIYQASNKTTADKTAYLNALTAAINAYSTCLQNCPDASPPPGEP